MAVPSQARRLIEITLLDHRAPTVAEQIVEVQQAGYRVEAQLTGYDGMPGLPQDAPAVTGPRRGPARGHGRRQLVGVLGYARHGDLVDVDRLAVHPDHFRRGIGAALLDGLHGARPMPAGSRS